MISQHKRDALDVILVENDSASAEICLFGAHLLSFIPHHDGRERLWLSPSAILDKSKPIRGGIPICWPWFGEAPPELSFIQPDLPPHGFIRNQDCLLVSAKQLSNSVDQIVLAPKSYPFKQLNLNLKLEIRITVGQELKVELITRNMASASVSYFAALHTYFKINDIDNLILGGINSDYFDKTRSMSLMPALENYTINEETDRVHIGSSPNITVEDMQLKTQIKSKGNDSIVVWNPWKMLSNSMVDMNEFGYRHMICVETARTQNGILEGNQTHTLTQIIS